MKKHLKLVTFICIIMVGAWAIVWAQSSIEDFGLESDVLETNLVNALVGEYVPAYPDKNRFKSASPALQAAFVRNALSWFEAYTASEAFKSDYARQREAARPSAPEQVSPDEMQAASQAEQRRDLERMRKEISGMPPEMQKEMQGILKQMEAEMDRMAKDPETVAMLKQSFADQNASRQQDYQERLAEWTNKYPEDSTRLLSTRLRHFLEVSGDVAFDAKLVPDTQNNLMKFADPQYEAKPKMWKLCYRAGREPVQAARAFVTQWLARIEKQ